MRSCLTVQSLGHVLGKQCHKTGFLRALLTDAARRFVAAFIPPVQVPFLSTFSAELVPVSGPREDDGGSVSLDDIREVSAVSMDGRNTFPSTSYK